MCKIKTQPQMSYHYSQKLWFSYLIAVVGFFCSLLLWLVFKHNLQAYFDLLKDFQLYLPWLALLFGLSFSFLIAALIGMAQLARQRAFTLRQINEDLKKEINERIQAEDIKQKLEVALLQGQKLQAMGTLAGGIAHDFNNILYAVIGYAEMAREDVPKESVVHKNLGKVIEAAHRGQELVSRILVFSRRQHHHFNPINLKTTIDAALALLKPTIPASVMIHFNPTEVTILGNQTQIHQVLVNIINNAVDAMDGEGTIHITMVHVLADDVFLKQFPNILSQNYCKIKISDTGHGMDQSTMERIFDPFYTTKEVGKGTGLGLSIVHSIIKEHQGEIMVTSRLGHGTTFMILLPEYAIRGNHG
ncbi:MAG: GHKL domain-containing protein [Gammaproteobacteria bacterium]|nr:GHKL domain-containing protein [Gammaproteobacteria bacterium]MCW5583092.1 GHKL domain-containing protein [Gammaproteobacteria bacterium]